MRRAVAWQQVIVVRGGELPKHPCHGDGGELKRSPAPSQHASVPDQQDKAARHSHAAGDAERRALHSPQASRELPCAAERCRAARPIAFATGCRRRLRSRTRTPSEWLTSTCPPRRAAAGVRDDPRRARAPQVVEDVVGVPARLQAADLHQPRPHRVRRRVDRDRPGGVVLRPRHQLVSRHACRDLLGGGASRRCQGRISGAARNSGRSAPTAAPSSASCRTVGGRYLDVTLIAHLHPTHAGRR